jgi:hypothetical protein
MKFISHRGNISSKNEKEENHPEKISYCLSLGYDVEIDVWMIKENFYLGHDEPQYKINRDFLLDNSKKLWCHAKNLNALKDMLSLAVLNCFWHQEDNFTVTSKKIIWTYPGFEVTDNSVVVIPEKAEYKLETLKSVYGICSDNIEHYKKVIING